MLEPAVNAATAAATNSLFFLMVSLSIFGFLRFPLVDIPVPRTYERPTRALRRCSIFRGCSRRCGVRPSMWRAKTRRNVGTNRVFRRYGWFNCRRETTNDRSGRSRSCRPFVHATRESLLLRQSARVAIARRLVDRILVAPRRRLHLPARGRGRLARRRRRRPVLHGRLSRVLLLVSAGLVLAGRAGARRAAG